MYLNKIGKPPNILKYIPEDKEKGIKQLLILDEDPIEKVRILFGETHTNQVTKTPYVCPVHMDIKNLNLPKTVETTQPEQPKKDHKATLIQNLASAAEVQEEQLIPRYKDESTITIHPKAAFVKALVKLNFKHDKNETPVMETEMLLDTGCMISCMRLSFYEKLNAKDKVKRYLNTNINLKSATNTTAPVLGMTSVKVYLLGGIKVDLDVMIIEELSQDFILGYDFLGSPIVKTINNKSMTVNNGMKYVKVQIITKHFETLASHAYKDAIVGAYQNALIAVILKNTANIKDQANFTLNAPEI